MVKTLNVETAKLNRIKMLAPQNRLEPQGNLKMSLKFFHKQKQEHVLCLKHFKNGLGCLVYFKHYGI